jgi:hypothetical protein
LKWRHQETWFGERVDPEFAAKRGRSRSSKPHRLGVAPSSASTSWVRRRPRARPHPTERPVRLRSPTRREGQAGD